MEIRQDTQGHLERYYFANGALCGVILLGDLSRMGEMIQAIEEKRTFAEVFPS